MAATVETIPITKLDAVRRQLRTAITLWFGDGDPVAIHTLAFAAYEIIHVVSKQRNRSRRNLLFDTVFIKDEHRSKFNISIKEHANFFKHARSDAEATIEFQPRLSELFMMYAVLGIELCREHLNDVERAYSHWLNLHHPNFFTEKGRKRFKDLVPSDILAVMLTVPKHQFLQVMLAAAKGVTRQ